jgi:serine/threonine protein kinase
MPKIEPGIILKERYKIISQLGTGGMGEVLLAEDLSLANQVAVKINHNLNETTSAQFIREARLLAALKHPNLPRVIDYFTDNECQYLVMDYVPGDDLKQVVERRQKLDPNQIIKWGVQLGNALTYLHNHKPPIFHRDIKPANIKLTPAGEVVLVDFGIAKTGEPSQETQTGAWAFSPGFAPPEQVSGMRTGPYSDQYSLAATLYYLFTGKPPADSAQRLMGAVQYEPLARVNLAVPDHVSEAIGKALSMRSEDRYPTVADFLTALTNPQATQMRSKADKTVMATRGNTSPRGPEGTPSTGDTLPPILASAPPPSKKSPLRVLLPVLLVLIVLAVGGYFGLNALGLLNAPLAATTAPTATQTLLPPTPAVADTPAAVLVPTFTSIPEATATPKPTTAAAIVDSIGGGGKVAFVSNRQGDGYFQLWLMTVGKDADGNLIATDFQQLTFSEGDKSQPSWSPDGTKILFTAPSKEFAKNGTPFAEDIWVLDITQKDAAAVDLTRRAGNDEEGVWSPDGKKIAFTSYYRDDGMPQLFLMNPDGSAQNRLSERFAEHSTTWTPDSSYLMYVMDYADYSILSMRDVWSVYQNTKKFDMSSDAGRLGLTSDPQISPDGLTIAYTRTIGTKTNIYTAVFADRGRTVTQLTDSGKDFASCWSPDSKWILFTSTRDDNAEIYIMAVDGSSLTNLTNFPAEEKEPAWQPAQP